VYLARHRHLNALAALNVLYASYTHDRGFRDRFLQEAQTQYQLQHPNIARVIDYIEQQDQYYLVVEYLPGGTITDMMDHTGGPVEVAKALTWAKQALSGLDYAHQRGVIHRDVKPSNIMFDESGCVKVVDFGIALVVGGRRLTSTGVTMGTPEYMSPEQIVRPKEVDHRTDVYSMGVVLYDTLTGRVPFEGDTDFAVRTAQVNDTPPPLRMLNPSISPALEQVVMKVLAKDPDQRYSGCGEFIGALEQFDASGNPATDGSGSGPETERLQEKTIVAQVKLADAEVERLAKQEENKYSRLPIIYVVGSVIATVITFALLACIRIKYTYPLASLRGLALASPISIFGIRAGLRRRRTLRLQSAVGSGSRTGEVSDSGFGQALPDSTKTVAVDGVGSRSGPTQVEARTHSPSLRVLGAALVGYLAGAVIVNVCFLIIPRLRAALRFPLSYDQVLVIKLVISLAAMLVAGYVAAWIDPRGAARLVAISGLLGLGCILLELYAIGHWHETDRWYWHGIFRFVSPVAMFGARDWYQVLLILIDMIAVAAGGRIRDRSRRMASPELI
ncbi:MAG: serine/threonine-protein kinase, partial [Blastocatellia bacterium]